MVNSGKVTTFESVFPLLAVENDCIVSKQGDITVGFKVKLPEIFTIGAGEYETIHSSWLRATLVLPEYTILHKQDWILKKNYVPNLDKEGITFLSKAFEKHFDKRPVITHTCYLFITKTTRQQMRRTSTFTSLTTGNIAPRTSLNKESVQLFIEAVDQFQSIVRESGFIELTKLTNEDYLGDEGILQKHISLQKPQVLEDFVIQGDSMCIGDDELCLHTLSHLDDLGGSVKTESRYAKLCTDQSDCMLSFASPLTLLLPCNHLFNQYLFLENHEETKKMLERKSKNMFSLGKFSRANIINQELVDDYLNTAEELKLTSCYAHCNVIAWSDDKEELSRVKNEVGSQLALMGCKPRHNKIDVPTLFFASLPGNEADFPSEERFLTFPEHALCLFSQETSYQSSSSKFGFKLVDPLTTKPIHVDISDEPRKKGIIDNRSKVVLGGSGTGKSFLMNHMIRQYYDQDAHIILVDMGNSYQGICELIRMQTNGNDGIYFTYKESEPISFNPFYTEDGIYSMDKKETLKTIILQLWKGNEQPIIKSENTAISSGITKYIARVLAGAYVPSFNTFYEFMRDEFENTVAIEYREKDFDRHNFLVTLEPYYKGGEYDYLLNSTSELDLLHKRFVVFEIDQLKDNAVLFPIVTLVIMEAYLNKVRRLDGIRKVLLLEEAWKAIANESMASYIKYLFKTVRKQFGEIIVVSQELDDLISSDIVKEAIIANSGCKILLNQSNNLSKFDAMQTAFGFTDNEKAQICTIGKSLDPNRNYKQVWIGLGSGGKHSKVYDVEVSMEEGIAYSTEQTEKVELYNLVAQNNGNLELSLSQLAEKKRKEIEQTKNK